MRKGNEEAFWGFKGKKIKSEILENRYQLDQGHTAGKGTIGTRDQALGS